MSEIVKAVQAARELSKIKGCDGWCHPLPLGTKDTGEPCRGVEAVVCLVCGKKYWFAHGVFVPVRRYSNTMRCDVVEYVFRETSVKPVLRRHPLSIE